MLIQMTKKMIEFLISGYEYYENERKSRHNEKIWLINQVKVIYSHLRQLNKNKVAESLDFTGVMPLFMFKRMLYGNTTLKFF